MVKSKKLTEEKIENIIGNVKVNLSMERMELTDEEITVIRKFLNGELTEKEALEIILKV
jgi:hypothetical protein